MLKFFISVSLISNILMSKIEIEAKTGKATSVEKVGR
jgi:hypothetical protein